MTETLLKRHLPEWLVFVIDVLFSIASMSFAFFLRMNFNIEEKYTKELLLIIFLTGFIRGLSFFLGRTYMGIVRYFSSKDAEKLFITIFAGTLLFLIFNSIRFNFFDDLYFFPRSVLAIDFFITIFLLVGYRIMAKLIFESNAQLSKNYEKVAIYGDENFTLITKQVLESGKNKENKLEAIFFDNIKNSGKKIDGIPVYDITELSQIINKYDITRFIIAKNKINSNLKNEIAEFCLSKNIKLLTIPPAHKWINGELSLNQIRQIKIEDLLEREPIVLNFSSIKKEILNKVVLVTGAAGSIGSELVRQMIHFNPKKIILIDQAESPLYDMELELQENLNFNDFKIFIADIKNKQRIENIFQITQPQVVFHAAAYKHVPMMENHPCEAINNNVFGTINVAEISEKYQVTKFIMISTDKAVNPTNIMGASKRLAEIYIQSKNFISLTRYITTRFGNVLGSNGSVIPRFKQQILSGGPVTVTHHEVTRFFMTIPEACQLVLEAAAMGNGGEIFVFDMGKAVKIVDLAKKMIKLSGLELGKDIQIQFTGLRPGEKLYEELLNTKENTLPTHHEQILIGKVRNYDFNLIKDEFNAFITLIQKNNNLEIVQLMKKIIPEFISENSIYSELDNHE
jgi:FlaA1/EpsC-like NDP-sugar epimerase